MTGRLTLAWRLLRYRVAAMIWMFLLLGAAHEGPLRWSWSYLWAGLALSASYIAATSLNDVADEDVDSVNHVADIGRPLVAGYATRGDLLRLHVVMDVAALCFAALINLSSLALVGAGILIAVAYSAPPMRISYRTLAAPLVLTIAYVMIPFGLGIVIASGRVSLRDVGFGAALALIFLARINLKDFRDRVGDARYGKPTLLLRFGKTATCIVSAVTLLLGDLVLMLSLEPPPPVALIAQVFVAAILVMLHSLWKAPSEEREQLDIGLGARIGNGLLLTVLAWLLLDRSGTPVFDATVFAAVMCTAYVGTALFLAARPERVQIAYKA